MGKRTGFSREVKDLVYERASGACEVCGGSSDIQYHHRRPRGMGSTRRPETNDASNCLLVCRYDHEGIESHRQQALANGWLIRQSGDPCMTPVLYRGGWVVLDNDGYTYRVPTPENEDGRA